MRRAVAVSSTFQRREANGAGAGGEKRLREPEQAIAAATASEGRFAGGKRYKLGIELPVFEHFAADSRPSMYGSPACGGESLGSLSWARDEHRFQGPHVVRFAVRGEVQIPELRKVVLFAQDLERLLAGGGIE